MSHQSSPSLESKTTFVLVVLAATFGIPVGLGAYTFWYAKGYSYLASDPAACVNCHIMNEQYEGWTKSSHHGVATCNDCHAPRDFLGKYYTKAENGFWHSLKFTTGRFHEPIRIRAKNLAVTEQACRTCHAALTSGIDAHAGSVGSEPLLCTQCHRSVGHLHLSD